MVLAGQIIVMAPIVIVDHTLGRKAFVVPACGQHLAILLIRFNKVHLLEELAPPGVIFV